jgi:hypothetical protein
LFLAVLAIVAVVILGFLLLGRPLDVGANARAWQDPELAPVLKARLRIGNGVGLAISPTEISSPSAPRPGFSHTVSAY